ncbi:MAG: ATP-dependent DNA helicase RecG [Acidobacteriota bacterium]
MTSGTGLDSPLSALRGVRPAEARAAAVEGVGTLGGLLWHLPHRYEDRSDVVPIAALVTADRPVTVAGRITHLVARRAHRRRMMIVEGLVDDGTAALPVIWFNQPYLVRALRPGVRVWLFGTLKAGRAGGGLQLVAPEWEIEDEDADPVHLGRIVPMYRRVGALSGRRIRTLVARALEAIGEVSDPLAGVLPRGLDLVPLDTALRRTHFPLPPERPEDAPDTLARLASRESAAHRRLAFDELLALAVVLEEERARRETWTVSPCRVTESVREKARAVLPFQLTGAQRRALAEIVADLQRAYPMARLLQGDVGSGKTIVALLAALVVLESGSQVAWLAPTELLAHQHLATVARHLAHARHAPELLVGSLPEAEKQRVRERLASGEPVLVIGTHALIQDEVAFGGLGLAVIDEQHRFGVSQRQALLAKGRAPHLLVMTATPIPRSLALSLYGDLDVSLIDELPPGRPRVTTVIRDDAAREKLIAFVRSEVSAGGRGYWVFPLIEESEKISARAVASHARTVREALGGVPVAIVHGRQPAAERERAMAAFAAGEVGVLCATSVIEVGVDVPEATFMVIENAERFGLAQLHQLRGRVGRGTRRSYCVLLLGAECPPQSLERLRAVAATDDGFAIAEEDFKLRGPGEFTGMRQWGRPEFRVALLWRHRAELEAARALAAEARARGWLERLRLATAGGTWLGRAVPTA